MPIAEAFWYREHWGFGTKALSGLVFVSGPADSSCTIFGGQNMYVRIIESEPPHFRSFWNQRRMAHVQRKIHGEYIKFALIYRL